MTSPFLRTLRAIQAVSLAALTLVVGGCEQLPWSRSDQDSNTATAASTAKPAAQQPPMPLVPPTEILATVNGVSIAKADLERRIQELKAFTQSVGQTWQTLPVEAPQGALSLKLLLDDLVDRELLSQDAMARGLDRSLEVQQRWQYDRRNFYAQEWVRWSDTQHTVNPSEVEAYYQANKLGFQEFERLHLRQLMVATEDQAKRALTQLHSGTVDFQSLAQQISLGPTAQQGGLLTQWVMRANEKAIQYGSEEEAQAAGVISLDPVLEAVAFAIGEVNRVSGYVNGPDSQYHIFQLVERQPARERPIAEVWDQIQNYLLEQKRREAVDALGKKAAIERFAERLSEVTQE